MSPLFKVTFEDTKNSYKGQKKMKTNEAENNTEDVQVELLITERRQFKI